MFVDDLCFFQELLVLLVAHIFAFDLLPALDLVHRANNTQELILFEGHLLKRGAALSEGSLKTSLQGKEKITKLIVSFLTGVVLLSLTEKDWAIHGRKIRVKRLYGTVSHGRCHHLVLDLTCV